MKLLTVATLFISMNALAAPALKSPWAGFSDPDIMKSGMTHEFARLPLEGSIEMGPRGWSGYYWASFKGGVNWRWNHPSSEGFKYKTYSLADLKKMSPEKIAQLSATEKYDIMLGRYDYPLHTEAKGTASPRAKEWAGICHGWAPAAIHHNEPTPKSFVNADGIEVRFASSDIKALISYYYAFHNDTDESTGQMGLRCYFGGWMGGYKACDEDLNAGALHIVMSNKLGLDQEGFLMDRDRYKEVWNQPVVGFKSSVVRDNLRPSSGAANSAVKEMEVKTDLYFVDESDPTWNPVFGTRDQKVGTMKLHYRLELNAAGKIVGGTWLSESRPDFLWNRSQVTNFNGLLSHLPKLLND